MQTQCPWDELLHHIQSLKDFLTNERVETYHRITEAVLRNDWEGAESLANHTKTLERGEALVFDMQMFFADLQQARQEGQATTPLPPPPSLPVPTLERHPDDTYVQASLLFPQPSPVPAGESLSTRDKFRNLLRSLRENETERESRYYMTPVMAVCHMAAHAYAAHQLNPQGGLRTVQAVEEIIEKVRSRLTDNDWNYKVRMSGQEFPLVEANLRRARTLLSSVSILEQGRHVWSVTPEGMEVLEELKCEVTDLIHRF